MFQADFEYEKKSEVGVPEIDPVAWAAMIDMVSAFNCEDFSSSRPPMPLPIKRSAPTTLEELANKSLEAITAAVNGAATKEDQLVLSCGLPLTFDKTTQRYSLAPTAAVVMKFQQENSKQRVPPKLNLGASTLFAKRTAAAAQAAAQAALHKLNIGASMTRLL